MSWQYVIINKCIVSCLHIWKMVPLGVNLKQNIQFHYLVSSTGLQFECILPLNRVRIEGFKQHRPNQTSFNPPPPPGKVSSLMHNDNPAAKSFFFFRAEWKTRDGTEGAQFRPPLIQTWLTSHQHSEPQLELLTPQTLQLVRYQERSTFTWPTL